jgi:hypothetical protein
MLRSPFVVTTVVLLVLFTATPICAQSAAPSLANPGSRATPIGVVLPRLFRTESSAQRYCRRDAVVWLNIGSGIYHEKNDSWYGNTATGAYVCRREANAAGTRAALSEQNRARIVEEERASALQRLIETAGFVLLVSAVGVFVVQLVEALRQRYRIERRIERAQTSLDLDAVSAEKQDASTSGDRVGTIPADENTHKASPALVQPAWDVARGTLERYWARNLTQNAIIFITSVFVCLLGFAVMLWGVWAAIQHQASTGASIVAASAGAVTQLIGATFLILYRSTAQQALEFNRTLERINSVGMAWYILQTMSETTPKEQGAKDAARLALVLSVMAATGDGAKSPDRFNGSVPEQGE